MSGNTISEATFHMPGFDVYRKRSLKQSAIRSPLYEP